MGDQFEARLGHDLRIIAPNAGRSDRIQYGPIELVEVRLPIRHRLPALRSALGAAENEDHVDLDRAVEERLGCAVSLGKGRPHVSAPGCDMLGGLDHSSVADMALRTLRCRVSRDEHTDHLPTFILALMRSSALGLLVIFNRCSSHQLVEGTAGLAQKCVATPRLSAFTHHLHSPFATSRMVLGGVLRLANSRRPCYFTGNRIYNTPHESIRQDD